MPLYFCFNYECSIRYITTLAAARWRHQVGIALEPNDFNYISEKKPFTAGSETALGQRKRSVSGSSPNNRHRMTHYTRASSDGGPCSAAHACQALIGGIRSVLRGGLGKLVHAKQDVKRWLSASGLAGCTRQTSVLRCCTHLI